MPTYEFKCNSCKEKFEIFVSISERSKVKCPICDSSDLSQILSGFYLMGTERGKDVSSSCTTCKIPSCSTCNIK